MTRKEAIKILMGYSYTPQERAAMEVLIPELAESEDERIRKALIYLVTTIGEYYLPKLEVRNKMLAYLEKQKEQEHPDWCFTCDEYKKGYEAGRLNGLTAGYNKAKKEQKPVEWSEEDEKTLASIIDYLNRSDLVGYDEFIEFEEFLQSLRPSWKPSEMQLEALDNARHSGGSHYLLDSLYNDLKKL